MTKKRFALSALVAALFITPATAQAQSWTGAPGAAVIDEQSAGIYDSDASYIAYKSTSTSTTAIVARYNLTDTTASGTPSWNTLELRYYDNSANSQVQAKVLKVALASASTTTLATCTSTDSASFTSVTCPLSTVNFTTGHTYIVEVTLTRSSSSATPYFIGTLVY